MDLQAEGYIAKVECNEVQVKMHTDFLKAYLDDYANSGMNALKIHQMRNRLFNMNPNKFQAMEFLIREHEARKDKIIVFSEDTFALKTFADKLYPNPTQDPGKQCYIRGDTKTVEREKILQRFRDDSDFQTIFASKVADNSLNLPDLCVLIQISSHGGGGGGKKRRGWAGSFDEKLAPSSGRSTLISTRLSRWTPKIWRTTRASKTPNPTVN